MNDARHMEVIQNFYKMMDEIGSDWNDIYEEVGKCDREMSDLLHEMELTEFNAVEGYQLALEIQKVRRRRRVLKNYQEVIQHMKEYSERNSSVKINVYKLITAINKTKEYQSKREYAPRIRTDLKLCSENNHFEHVYGDDDILEEDIGYLDVALTDNEELSEGTA